MHKQLNHYLLLVIFTFTLSNISHAEIIYDEEAIETNEFSTIGSYASGFVVVKKCDKCPSFNLQLNKQSRAFHKGKLTELNKVPKWSKKGITIFYNPKTKVVTRVRW